MSRLAFSIVFLVSIIPARSFAGPLVLTDQSDSISVADDVEYFEDFSESLTFQDVVATSQWRPLENKSMTFSPGKTPLWFRFSVENQASQEHWVLRFVSPLLDRIEFYSSSPQIKPRVAGRSLRFDMRDFPDRTVAFNFSVQPHKRETFYVRIQMEGGRVCAMNILSTHEENQTIARESVIFGIYFGALIIMALYNVLLYFSVRDRSYIIYGVNTLAFLSLQMGITGYGFEYVIPDTPHYFRIWLHTS